MNKFFNLITSRIFLIILSLLVQLTVLITIIIYLSNYFVYFYGFFVVISLLITIFILLKDDNPSYKIAWIVPILALPVFGGIFYLMFGKSRISNSTSRKLNEVFNKTSSYIDKNDKVMDKLGKEGKEALKQATYLTRMSDFPVYDNTQTEFLETGEKKFAVLCEELKKAKKYIFLEYFIISPGKMLDTVLDILVQKIEQGVEVRLAYDDIGSLKTVPKGYDAYLRSLGIKVYIFNPMRPSLDIFMNNRDHRKIVVIDGEVGFTGGINLADEYINEIERFGHWKDSSIMIKGDAVWNLTVMTLQLWEFGLNEAIDYDKYRPAVVYESDGYVLPFSDSPMDDVPISEYGYMHMINNANRYIYITTPYLILDFEMSQALVNAARQGIDVRIITPHIEDKWYVHAVTRANYAKLILGGVKIYEYTPGFIHSKTMVVDDEFAFVGSANFDYRSFYLHFECGVWLYKSSCVAAVAEDFLKTKEQSERITMKTVRSYPLRKKVQSALIQPFAVFL